MNNSNDVSKQPNLSSKSIGVGLFAAVVASLCCITPVFSVLAGIGGIASAFSWMEPFRPYLIALTLGVLAFAWYQKLKPRTAEEIECDCEEDEKPSFWQSRKFLGMVTLFAVVMLAFPYYTGIFFPENNASQSIVIVKESDIVEASLTIEGMTCTGCEYSVNYALTESEGVLEASSSFESGIASVKFDQSKISINELSSNVEEATGYKVVGSAVIN
jgi:mercuric ion transport protein